MALRKHPSKPNTWQIIISQGRKQKQIVTNFTGSLIEAEAAEREIRGIAADASSKIIDLVAQYLEWYKTNRLPASYDELQNSLKRLLPHFGDIPAAFITRPHLEAYKNARLLHTWQGKTTSKITINRELKHLMALIRWSTDQGTIAPITLKPVYFKSEHCEEESRKIDVLTAEELNNLFNNLTGNTGILYRLMFWTGIRKTEATKLQVRDIDIKRKLIQIAGKGGRKRLAAIPDTLLPMIKEAVKGKKQENLLCPNPLTGFPYGDLRTPLETAAKKAGITKRIHPHGLRHSHGTALIQQGASLPEVGDSLGHSPSSLSVTRRYIHLAADNVTKQSSRLNDFMTPSILSDNENEE